MRFAFALVIFATATSCRPPAAGPALGAKGAATVAPAPHAKAAPSAPAGAAGLPLAQQAQRFMAGAEAELLQHWLRSERAEWITATYITDDTQRAAAEAQEAVAEAITRLAKQGVRYRSPSLDARTARKLKLLSLSPSLPAPSDPKGRALLAAAVAEQQALYGKGRYCVEGPTKLRIGKGRTKGKRCFPLGELSKRMAESRDYDELLEIWRGWRSVSPQMRKHFDTYVKLANAGAQELGFADVGALWKSRFDMAPERFEQTVDRLWKEVQPLYEQLHCYVRAKLAARYGKRVSLNGPIPAHLLGNMWAQDWAYLAPLVLPKGKGAMDIGRALARKKADAKVMVRYAERFFVSLGMDALPQSFWQRSMLIKPKDRDVVCHASAWAVDLADDLRIKMCIRVNGEDFTTIHHELGHIYYFHYYKGLDPLFRDSANKGFHEGLGDTISLSVTPGYLAKVGLAAPTKEDAIATLLERALEKVAFLPFGLLIDKWRWDVFSGKVDPAAYNAHWWKLRRSYQGIAAPVARSESDFDPGAKYHVAGNVPYVRYFLAHILQFQFHKALCKISGHQGPLNQCSIYGSKEAGARLMAMMRMGQQQPWPEALFALTGQREMSARPLLEYFEPLQAWLKEQNKGLRCGW